LKQSKKSSPCKNLRLSPEFFYIFLKPEQRDLENDGISKRQTVCGTLFRCSGLLCGKSVFKYFVINQRKIWSFFLKISNKILIIQKPIVNYIYSHILSGETCIE